MIMESRVYKLPLPLATIECAHTHMLLPLSHVVFPLLYTVHTAEEKAPLFSLSLSVLSLFPSGPPSLPLSLLVPPSQQRQGQKGKTRPERSQQHCTRTELLDKRIRREHPQALLSRTFHGSRDDFYGPRPERERELQNSKIPLSAALFLSLSFPWHT